MKRHASEQRLASFQTFHTRRGPELRLVQARPAGHSLADELPPKRQQAYRPRTFMGIEVGTVDDIAYLAAGVVIFGVLFIGTPLLLWLIGAPK